MAAASMIRAFSALRRPLRQSLGATARVTIPPDKSALRPTSHGFDAILVSLILMRPLLGHDGLTDWYIRIAASLVVLAGRFFSKMARRIMLRPSVGRGLFRERFCSFGLYRVCSASTCGVGFGVTVRARRDPNQALVDVEGKVCAVRLLGIGNTRRRRTTSCNM